MIGYDFRAQGCQGSFVEVKVAKQLVIGRELWVESGGTQHVECCHCLWDESAPKVRGKSFVGAIQNGDEVAFERSDRPLGEVVPVVVGIGKLVVKLF